MVEHPFIMGVMRRHPEIPGISIDDGAAVSCVAMHSGIHTVADPEKVRGHTDYCVLTFFDSCHLTHSRDEDRTVDAAANQEGVNA
jgi:hypothetical protein